MYIEEELKRLTKNISSNEMMNKILKAYLKELKRDEFYDIEQEYWVSKRILNSKLTSKQKNFLKTIENLFSENMKYSVEFGFKRGIYAGFKQFFTSENTKAFFDKSVCDELLTMPHMKKHTEYYNRQIEINQLSDRLMEDLEKEYQEHIITIYCTYDEKNYGVLRYAFYMGYRYALAVIEDINPFGVMDIADKILNMEHSLGFTMTYRDRERQELRKSFRFV